MLKATNLTMTYSGDPVFKDISFVLDKSSVIGLVGENGAGKTTLLKIISGEIDYYEGVFRLENEVLGYMPQEVEFGNSLLVGEFIEASVPIWELYKFEKALRFLGFDNYDEYQTIETLSGGEKTKLFLASLMVDDPTVLLLDEPTNHLDVDSMVALRDFLGDYSGKVIIVSHDRAFLDETVSRVWELGGGKFKEYVGNYSSYEMQKEHEAEIVHKEHVNWLKKKEKLEQLIENARKIKAGDKRGSAISSAKKRYEREVVKKEVEDPYAQKDSANLSLSGQSHSGKLILKIDGLRKEFDKKEILRSVQFEIRGNEKVWLYGKNGSGKTTVVKEIYSLLTKTSEGLDHSVGSGSQFDYSASEDESITIGNALSIGYYAQTQEILNFENTLEDEIQRLGNIHWEKGISMLQNLGFSKNQWDYKVKSLSFGQRARLIFGAFSLGDYNFLILDEPTNHLDINTRAVIENALVNYKGAMLIISHDRYFVNELGINRVLFLENGRISKQDIL